MKATKTSLLTSRSFLFSLALLTVCAAAAFTRPARADEPTAPLVTADGATAVVINSVVVMRFHVSSGGYSPQERWAIVTNRIIKATHEFENVNWAWVHGEPAIYIHDSLIVTVTDADADANGCSPRQLASIWTDNLRHAVDKMHR
jgi:hypothetical protein